MRAIFACTSWKVGERLAELATVAGVGDRLVEGARRHAAGGRGHRRPQAVERAHAELEAGALLAEQRVCRQRQPSNGELAERVRRGEHLRAGEAQARSVGGDQEAGETAAARRAVGGGEDAVEVGDAGVRDERLAAVELPAVAVAAARSSRARRRRCRPRARSSRRRPSPRRARRAAASASRCASLPREGDRHRAQALQREDRVGERRGGGERLADQAAGAQVGCLGAPAPRRRHGPTQPAAGAEAAEDLARLARGRPSSSGGDGSGAISAAAKAATSAASSRWCGSRKARTARVSGPVMARSEATKPSRPQARHVT